MSTPPPCYMRGGNLQIFPSLTQVGHIIFFLRFRTVGLYVLPYVAAYGIRQKQGMAQAVYFELW